jgi:hypothetical protein
MSKPSTYSIDTKPDATLPKACLLPHPLLEPQLYTLKRIWKILQSLKVDGVVQVYIPRILPTVSNLTSTNESSLQSSSKLSCASVVFSSIETRDAFVTQYEKVGLALSSIKTDTCKVQVWYSKEERITYQTQKVWKKKVRAEKHSQKRQK